MSKELSTINPHRETLAQDTTQQVFGNTLPPTWLSLAFTFRRTLKHTPAGGGSEVLQPSRDVVLARARERAEANLKAVARTAWLLLLDLLHAQGFTMGGERGEEGGTRAISEIVSWERFALVLACIHEKSWDVGGGLCVPSRLALYANACLSAAASEDVAGAVSGGSVLAIAAAHVFRKFLPALEVDDDEEEEERGKGKGKVVQKGGKDGKGVDAIEAAASKEAARKRKTQEEAAAVAVLQRAREMAPCFSGTVLFPSACRVSVVEEEADANCDLVFEGPSLEVIVVATRDIMTGQQLCLAANCFQSAEEQQETDEEG